MYLHHPHQSWAEGRRAVFQFSSSLESWKTNPSLLHTTTNSNPPSHRWRCFRFIKHPKTNKTKSKACFSRDPYQSLGFYPTPLCMDMQGCTFAIPLCCWKSKSWKQVFWHVMVFQCLVTIKLTDSCLAGCPKPTFR